MAEQVILNKFAENIAIYYYWRTIAMHTPVDINTYSVKVFTVSNVVRITGVPNCWYGQMVMTNELIPRVFLITNDFFCVFDSNNDTEQYFDFDGMVIKDPDCLMTFCRPSWADVQDNCVYFMTFRAGLHPKYLIKLSEHVARSNAAKKINMNAYHDMIIISRAK